MDHGSTSMRGVCSRLSPVANRRRCQLHTNEHGGEQDLEGSNGTCVTEGSVLGPAERTTPLLMGGLERRVVPLVRVAGTWTQPERSAMHMY